MSVHHQYIIKVIYIFENSGLNFSNYLSPIPIIKLSLGMEYVTSNYNISDKFRSMRAFLSDHYERNRTISGYHQYITLVIYIYFGELWIKLFKLFISHSHYKT